MGLFKTHNIWFKAASLKLSKAKLPLRETNTLLLLDLLSAFHLSRGKRKSTSQ